MRRPFVKLIIFFISYLWLTTFVGAVTTPFIYAHGITFWQLALSKVILFGAQIFLLLFLTKFSSRISWYFAFISYFLSVIFIIILHSQLELYISSVFLGFVLYLYFVFYNISHYSLTPQNRIGISAGLMYGLGPIVSTVVPLIAGLLAQINYNFIWIVGFISLILCLYLVRFQNNFSISYNLKDSLTEIAPVRSFIFLEGVWEALIYTVIPVYTLFFFKTPLYYAGFLSYLALVGVFANLILGRLTDKLQKRVVFLYPITIFMALTTFLFAFSTENVTFWIICSGIISFLLPTFWNITTAMVVDSTNNLKIAIPGRELVLAVGRISGLTIAFISFLFEKTPHFIFFILGIALLLFPINLFWKTKLSKKYSYL